MTHKSSTTLAPAPERRAAGGPQQGQRRRLQSAWRGRRRELRHLSPAEPPEAACSGERRTQATDGVYPKTREPQGQESLKSEQESEQVARDGQPRVVARRRVD